MLLTSAIFLLYDKGKVGGSVMLLYFHSKNLLFVKHRPILTAYSFPVFIAIVVSFDCFLFASSLMDPGALGKELPADNPLETAISRKRAPTNELTMLAGQPMEMKNSKKQALAKELTTLADKLLKQKLEEQQGPHRAYHRNSDGHVCEAQG